METDELIESFALAGSVVPHRQYLLSERADMSLANMAGVPRFGTHSCYIGLSNNL